MVSLGNEWDYILKNEFDKEYYLKLRQFLKKEYAEHIIYPKAHNIFNALRTTSYNDVKAVILGQDPYHNPNQAHGLAFSVQKGTIAPPSLINIFKELQSDLGIEMPKTGDLSGWAKQGVLLLNAILTVRHGAALSHSKKGWETFTDTVISHLNEREKPIVFLLWGRPAQQKQSLITNKHHYILTAPHPSPLSAFSGFFGCKHFSKTNNFLHQNNIESIKWQV
ncbi:MAG: uracil-DNA glycosylase [Clostridiaceae bacterium]|jgi:uracil-DNA glycosylase|nr:uracil-DNA glycosylase [Clostridiaceae bacterium]